MFDDAKIGASHSIPLSTNFKLAKFLSVSVGVQTMKTYGRLRPSRAGKTLLQMSVREIVLDTVRGFDRFNRYGLSSSVGTTVYGTYTFKEGKKLQAIRHVARPSVGWGYGPSFERYYDSYTNLDGEEVSYSRFEGTLNGSPSLGNLTVFLSVYKTPWRPRWHPKILLKLNPEKYPF
jgi:hypothetical protein